MRTSYAYCNDWQKAQVLALQAESDASFPILQEANKVREELAVSNDRLKREE